MNKTKKRELSQLKKEARIVIKDKLLDADSDEEIIEVVISYFDQAYAMGQKDEHEKQREYLRKYDTASKLNRIKHGICWSCKSKLAYGNSYYCEKHREMHRLRNAERRYKLKQIKNLKLKK